MKYWQEDNWTQFENETGEVVDANLWTCDKSGRQYITFYPTTWNSEGYYTPDGEYREGFRETDTSKPLAKFKVILEEVTQ